MYKDFVKNMIELYKDNLQFIGLRGSRSLGLADSNSDTDYLIVVSNLKKNKTIDDTQVINVKTFIYTINSAEIACTEALFNPLYINEKFFDIYRKLLKLTYSSHYNDILYNNVFRALKNYYKRADKTNKVISKIYLYYNLILDFRYRNIVDIYRSKQFYKDTVMEYRNIRDNKYTINDKNKLLESVRELIEKEELKMSLYDKADYNKRLLTQGIQRGKIIAIERKQCK